MLYQFLKKAYNFVGIFKIVFHTSANQLIKFFASNGLTLQETIW